MISFLQEKFALSQEGAIDLRNAIFWHTLFNLITILPAILAFIFLQDYLNFFVLGTPPSYSMSFYLIFSLITFFLMYVIAYIDYDKTYTKMYNESASRRIKLAETLRALPMAFFGKKDMADLSSIIMEDTTQIEQIFSHAVPQTFAATISITLLSLAMFIYDWRMSLAMFWVVPFGFLVFYLSKQHIEQGHSRIYAKKRKVTEVIQTGLDMLQEIKSYNQETAYLQSLEKQLDAYEGELINSELAGGALLNLSHFILKLGLPSVILVGAYFYVHDGISLFTYLVFLVIVGRIYDPFIDAMNNFAALLYLKVRIKRMKEMDSMPIQSGRKTFNPKYFDIEFQSVDFSYEGDVKTLENISFIAKQGKVTALIGPSGGGKSTVAKLAARFWDIDKGKILLGGEDISKVAPEALLEHFSIVFQDVMLFNTSILDNIRLGRTNATDKEVKEAAALAQCSDFIERLPEGYHTLIGENGEKLSGGERQRISIARALLKDAPIILLDEATASLDARNERKIQQAISELISNKTVLIIAHRMRTVINADNIVALRGGKIVESGPPETLMKQNGIFSSMLDRQKQENN